MSSQKEPFLMALSGGLASMLATSLVYPLEMSFLTQLQPSQSFCRKDIEELEESPRQNDLLLQIFLNGVASWLKKIMKPLYRGYSWKLMENFLRNFLYYFWYQYLKKKLYGSKRKGNLILNLLAAFLAAVCNQLLLCPLEAISIRLQLSAKRKSVATIISDVFHQSGFRGFYKGLKNSLILCANPAITNFVYDQSSAKIDDFFKNKSMITEDNSPDSISFLTSLIAAVYSKSIATILTYPFLRAKLLALIQSGNFSVDNNSTQNNLGNDTEHTQKKEKERKPKLAKLHYHYTGLRTHLLKTCLIAAILFTSKNQIQLFLKRITSPAPPSQGLYLHR